MYDLESGNMYTVDKWCHYIEQFTVTDDNGIYNPSTTYKLIKITINDVKYYKKNKKFPNNIECEINNILNNNSYFFRISQRSPKDAFMKEYKPKKSYHYSKLLELEKLRKEKLMVNSINQIYILINKSKRVKEDFLLFSKQNKIDSLYLVFQEWRPSNGVEYRTFIKNKKLIAICLYKPEFYSSKTCIPVELITNFINLFLNIKFIKETYNNLILDIFVDNNRVYFIEINPYEEYVDTFSFSWDEINNTSQLIIKL